MDGSKSLPCRVGVLASAMLEAISPRQPSTLSIRPSYALRESVSQLMPDTSAPYRRCPLAYSRHRASVLAGPPFGVADKTPTPPPRVPSSATDGSDEVTSPAIIAPMVCNRTEVAILPFTAPPSGLVEGVDGCEKDDGISRAKLRSVNMRRAHFTQCRSTSIFSCSMSVVSSSASCKNRNVSAMARSDAVPGATSRTASLTNRDERDNRNVARWTTPRAMASKDTCVSWRSFAAHSAMRSAAFHTATIVSDGARALALSSGEGASFKSSTIAPLW
mmetsp:Transcript_8310/g.23756  ORF Transcript_8310/g.23756 Transcript_8310/m.23756 type:complete len:275 (-) Transcript_8310:749-1573(-)